MCTLIFSPSSLMVSAVYTQFSFPLLPEYYPLIYLPLQPVLLNPCSMFVTEVIIDSARYSPSLIPHRVPLSFIHLLWQVIIKKYWVQSSYCKNYQLNKSILDGCKLLPVFSSSSHSFYCIWDVSPNLSFGKLTCLIPELQASSFSVHLLPAFTSSFYGSKLCSSFLWSISKKAENAGASCPTYHINEEASKCSKKLPQQYLLMIFFNISLF